MTDIERSVREVYTFNRKKYFSLYQACYAKAKERATERYLTHPYGWNAADESRIKPKYRKQLLQHICDEPPRFNTFEWNRIVREIATQLFTKEKAR